MIDPAEAARLAALAGSGTDGIYEAEIVDNPKITFIGDFGVPTENIENCPSLP